MRHSKRRNRNANAWVWMVALFALWKGSDVVTPPSNAPTVPPGGSPSQLSLAQLRQLAHDLGFPDPNLAAAVAMAESRGFPGAKRISDIERSFGLWQVNTRAHPEFDEGQLLDPTYNGRAALVISHGGTVWTPWTTFNTGEYRKYLGGEA